MGRSLHFPVEVKMDIAFSVLAKVVTVAEAARQNNVSPASVSSWVEQARDAVAVRLTGFRG
nr:hypothetical protein [Kibdelosporangium sp. MJ126-NF4]CTQ96827.1 hypothetical protein [Kibdelosporangium sp. MJ126-NF4]